MIDTIIYRAFARHSDKRHGADYEVCSDWSCRLAYLIERIFRREYDVRPD